MGTAQNLRQLNAVKAQKASLIPACSSLQLLLVRGTAEGLGYRPDPASSFVSTFSLRVRDDMVRMQAQMRAGRTLHVPMPV